MADDRDIQIETMALVAKVRERNYARCREARDDLARALLLVHRRLYLPETQDNGGSALEIATKALKEAGYL